MNNSILSKIRWPRPFAGLRGITLADVPREVSAGVTLAAFGVGVAAVSMVVEPATTRAAFPRE